MFDKIKNYALGFMLLAVAFAGGYVLAGGFFSIETCDSMESQPESDDNSEPLSEKTCAAIETLLEERIGREFSERDGNPDNRIGKARIYANIMRKGCPENREKYKALALREVEIGIALAGYMPADVLDIYGRLGMEAEAAALMDGLNKQCGYDESCKTNLQERYGQPILW